MHKSIRKWGVRIVKTGSSDRTTSLIRNKFTSRNAKNVPKSAYREIDDILAEEQKGEIYGSAAQYTHSYSARQPEDIDLASSTPEITAGRIQSVLRSKGIRSKISRFKTPNTFIRVEAKRKGKWVEVAGIHEIKGHYDKYDVYGSALEPERIGRFRVQGVRDQMYRKANSVMAPGGARPNRMLKDETDFVTISRLRLDEKQLQAEAELKRVRKARRSLEKIKQHVKSHKGWSARKYPLNRDPIPEPLEQQFINFAVKNPEVDVRNIDIKNKKVSTRQKIYKKRIKNFFDIDTAVINKAYDYWTQ